VTWPLASGPATLWPPHHDPRVFTWVMASITRRLTSTPLGLFHGDAFYPNGLSLAYTELLLPPALLGLPGFVWGNPILTYNLLLLLLWPVNGVALAWAAHAITGSRPAAWLAATVFCLSPYFTEYYLEFQMLLAAPVPVAILAWVRWLESLRGRWLVIALAAFVVQALATWYYGVILAVALGTLAVGFACLRWRGFRWKRALGMLAVGGVSAAAVLLPFAWPYLEVTREIGFYRGLDEVAMHSADLATFIEPGRRSVWRRFAPAGHVAETSAFVGFTILALSAASLGWLRGERPGSSVRTWGRRGVLTVLVLTLLATGWVLASGPKVEEVRALSPAELPAPLLGLVVVLALVLLLIRGVASSEELDMRPLQAGDWVCLLLVLVGVFVLLALGPVIHVRREPVGPGPYLALYRVLPVLPGLRVTTRFAVVTVAGLGLLAALGWRALEARLAARPGLRWGLGLLIVAALSLEYAVAPAAYQETAWTARPVDRFLRAERDDVAILEWPTNVWRSDAEAMIQSLHHGHRLVNGLSGFVPRTIVELGQQLSGPEPTVAVEKARAALVRIYPLRYLVVRLGDRPLRGQPRRAWEALRHDPPPPLRFRGTFGRDDLYEIVPLPERGVVLERWVSHEFLRTHPVMRFSARPLAAERDLDQWVEVLLNQRPLERIPLQDATEAQVVLIPPFLRAAPNVLRVRYGYGRTVRADDPRYRIGGTGARAPGDLRVVSAGLPFGDTALIQLNGADWAPGRRGYNLVAFDASGQLLGAQAFDTSARPKANRELAAWVEALPAGTVVAGAVRDEGSGRLTDEGVRALGVLGVSGDLRGRYRESHAFLGVKGTRPGDAVEALGARIVELTVGHIEVIPGAPANRLGFELTAFRLDPPATATVTPAPGPHLWGLGQGLPRLSWDVLRVGGPSPAGA
jgi:Interleukin-like EMT inducer